MDDFVRREAVRKIVQYMPPQLEAVNAIPAADVKPVVRGKWVQKREQITIDSYWIRWECSECGYCRAKGWEHSSDGKKPIANLCEMCGADMREVEHG